MRTPAPSGPAAPPGAGPRTWEDLAAHVHASAAPAELLGHLFERSLADGEPAPSRRTPSRRRSAGAFHTPAALAEHLVQATLAVEFAERRAACARAEPWRPLAAWQRHREGLRGLRLLDPACGSGVLLLAAFDALQREHAEVGRAIAGLTGEPEPREPPGAIARANLFGVDLDPTSVEVARLSLRIKAAGPGEPLAAVDLNLRRANSVVSDGALDPHAFDWVRGCLAREPDGDPRWQGRFDVVLANPPYVRHERLAKHRAHWQTEFRAFDGQADLYIYFLERALQRLRAGGRLGCIVSNKWLRGGYAAALRGLLAREATIDSVVDFGHAPLFPGADAFPCVLTLRNAPPDPGHSALVTQFPRAALPDGPISAYVATHRHAVPQSRLGAAPWSLEPPGVDALLRKIGRLGIPLAEYAGTRPHYGVKTGCNAAFVVDAATRDRLCREDPPAAAIFHKLLRGQDLGRWAPEWAGQWLIALRRGVDIAEYPAVLRHLEPLRARLEPRPPGLPAGASWPGRRPGHHAWFELQDPVDYFALFARPKIIYQEIQYHPAYAADDAGYLLNNKGFMIPTADPWLLGVLNSPLMWWHNWRCLVHLKDDALSPAGDRVAALPIARPTPAQHDALARLVPRIAALTRGERGGRDEVLDELRARHGVAVANRRLGDVAAVTGDAFVAAVARRRRARHPLSGPEEAALRTLHARAAAASLERRTQIAALEREIAGHVRAAYGLTAADLALLWQTAPPRMPCSPDADALERP